MVITSTFAACLDTIRMVFSPGLYEGKITREKKCVSAYAMTMTLYARDMHFARCSFLVCQSVVLQISRNSSLWCTVNPFAWYDYTYTARCTRTNSRRKSLSVDFTRFDDFCILLGDQLSCSGLLQRRKCLCKYDSAGRRSCSLNEILFTCISKAGNPKLVVVEITNASRTVTTL